MKEIRTEEDLKGFTGGGCNSSRPRWSVLVGEDEARPLIDTVSSGDDEALRRLLLQPHWVETILQKPYLICEEDRPLQGTGDVRPVHATQLSNLLRAIVIAAGQAHAVVVATLLEFAVKHGIEPSTVITRWAVNPAIRHGHAAVIRAFAHTYPAIVRFNMGHEAHPLYEAVRLGKYEVATVLLELGADPIHPVGRNRRIGAYGSSLMSRAAMCVSSRMVQLLLDHGVPIAGSAALHTAAARGLFDTVRLLLDHGADVNEKVPAFGFTPLHFAAWKANVEAMEFLRLCGADPDIKDDKGRTAAQVLEEGGYEAWRRS